MTCIAMQPLITSCCYEGMRMLHAVRPAQRRRPRDGAAGIRAAPEGRRFKEAAAAHPAATRQGTAVGWPPRRCGKMAGQAFLWLLYFISFFASSAGTPPAREVCIGLRRTRADLFRLHPHGGRFDGF